MKLRIILLTCVMTLWAISTSGCNTWRGVGKDVEKTGEAIQGE